MLFSSNVSQLSELNQSEYGANATSLNGSANGEASYEAFYTTAQFITGLFIYPTLCLFGLTGNVISVIVLNEKNMATSTNTFLTALAVSDGIKLLTDVSYFLVILLLNVDDPVGRQAYSYLYPYAHYFFNMSVCVTAWLTVSVAVERYLLVCRATKARQWCTIRRARLISAAVFVSMSLLTVPLGLRYRTASAWDVGQNASVLSVEVTKLWRNAPFVAAYTWVQNLVRSIVPLCVLCVLNCCIVRALRHRRRDTAPSHHRVTLTLVSVIVVFLVCVTPDAVMSAFFGLGYYDASFLVRGVREVTDLLLTLNSTVNFILYYAFNTVFRKSCYRLFCKNCPRLGLGERAILAGRVVSDRRAGQYICLQPLANGRY